MTALSKLVEGTATVAIHRRKRMWIVVNIGCIECGVSSNIVGIFTDESQAEAIAEKLDNVMSWREGGQNAYQVFPLPANANEPTKEYAEAVGEMLEAPAPDTPATTQLPQNVR